MYCILSILCILSNVHCALHIFNLYSATVHYTEATVYKVVIYCTLDSVVLLFNIRALNCLGQGGEMLKPRLLSPCSPPPSYSFIFPPDFHLSSRLITLWDYVLKKGKHI